jgi:flagellar motor switch/type III secretory pathway protein FliN
VTVLVNGKPFARGEIVAIGERFGVRLLEIISTTHMEGPR